MSIHLAKEEVEDWHEGILECSFDKRQHKKEGLTPEREAIGTVNERFVVTRREINVAISMVRRYASAAEINVHWRIPDAAGPIFKASKDLFVAVLSLEFGTRNLASYENAKLKPHDERLAKITAKIEKLNEFTYQVKRMISELVLGMGALSDDERMKNAQIREEVEATRTTTKTRRPNSRTGITHGATKKPAKKKFSLAEKLGG